MPSLELLILCNVFQRIEVGFLQIVHIKSDIDQTFRTTSRWLRAECDHNGLSHGVLSKCYNEYTTVSSLKQVANLSSLCGDSGFLLKVEAMTQYRFFKFVLDSGDINKRKETLHCLLRGVCVWSMDRPTNWRWSIYCEVCPGSSYKTSRTAIWTFCHLWYHKTNRVRGEQNNASLEAAVLGQTSQWQIQS